MNKVDSTVAQASDPVLAPYFTCAPLKLAVMSVCTFGMYGWYWFFVNWLVIKNNHPEAGKIRPFWRAIFSVFWSFSCYKHIEKDANKVGLMNGLPLAIFALGYLLITVMIRLPDGWWMLFYLNFIMILPVNSLTMAINRSRDENHPANNKISLKNLFAIAVGGTVFITNLLYLISPDMFSV